MSVESLLREVAELKDEVKDLVAVARSLIQVVCIQDDRLAAEAHRLIAEFHADEPTAEPAASISDEDPISCEDAALNAALAFAKFPDHPDGTNTLPAGVLEEIVSDEEPIPKKSFPTGVKRRRVGNHRQYMNARLRSREKEIAPRS